MRSSAAGLARVPHLVTDARVLAAVLLLLAGLLASAHAAPPDVDAALDAALSRVRDGRIYHHGFPGTKTRNQVRQSYLGVDADGNPAGTDKYGLLHTGMTEAVDVRTDAAKSVAATRAQLEQAQDIAWQAIEEILQGQLIAGNGNLLKGLRVAFPGAGGAEKPGGDDQVPHGCPTNADGKEYSGSNVMDLCYARLRFFRGVAAAFEFLHRDSTGEMRAIDRLNTPEFPQYTAFADPNFDPDGGLTDIQTAGYLLGNTLDRYGKAVIGIADRLWRAAYFDKARSPGGSRAHERQDMLDAAVQELQTGLHSQYLAVLPLAARFEDGSGGENAFQICRLDQVRVSAATASAFIERIQRGEEPKISNISLHASKTNIDHTLSLVGSLKQRAQDAYDEAEAKIWAVKEGEAAMVEDAQGIRWRYADNLYFKTGIDIGEVDEPPYFALSTEPGRRQYRDDVVARLEESYALPSDDPRLTDYGDIGIKMLNYKLAEQELQSACDRIDAVPMRVKIEEDKTAEIEEVIMETVDRVTPYILARAVADSITMSYGVTISATGVAASSSFSINPMAFLSAWFELGIRRAEAVQTCKITRIESEAAIKNLLIEQNDLINQAEEANIRVQLARSDINALMGEINTFVESHIYFQESNQTKWHYDPALVFEQEEAEIEYETALQEYVRELYKLSQLLAARWSEPFENPYLKADGVGVTLGGGLYDDFTQPESIFNVYQVGEASDFHLALKAWDTALRAERAGGQADIQSVISLRQDVLGLSDVSWNPDQSAFEYEEDLHEANLRRFRAFMLSQAHGEASPFWLRIDFPISYGQQSQSLTGPSRTPIIRAVRTDWNIRITEMSAKLVGANVAPGSPSDHYRIDLYQYGRIQFPRYHPRQTGVRPNFLTFDLPLYYPDPAEQSISPFQYTLQAGINGAEGTPNTGVQDREPTPFSSQWILLVFRDAGPLNIQNIEDVILNIEWRSGIPPAFNWPS